MIKRATLAAAGIAAIMAVNGPQLPTHTISSTPNPYGVSNLVTQITTRTSQVSRVDSKLVPSSIISDGVNQVLIWWHPYTVWCVEYSPDGLAWFELIGGTTDTPQYPVVIVENGIGIWWTMRFYRMIDSTPPPTP
jgi:hypothetical protein